MKKRLLNKSFTTLSLVFLGMLAGCRDGEPAGNPPASSRPVHYACPAHPMEVSREAGSCPECGAQLVAQKSVGTYICVDHFESAGVLSGELSLIHI